MFATFLRKLTTFREVRNVLVNVDNVDAEVSNVSFDVRNILAEVNNVSLEVRNVTEKLDNTPKKHQHPHPFTLKNPPSSAGRA